VFVQHLLGNYPGRGFRANVEFWRERSGPSVQFQCAHNVGSKAPSENRFPDVDEGAATINDALHISGPLGAIYCEKSAEKRAKASGIEVKKNWTSRAPYWSCGNETKGHSSQPQERPSGEFCGQKNWRKEG
jgi:hypothetical protein